MSEAIIIIDSREIYVVWEGKDEMDETKEQRIDTLQGKCWDRTWAKWEKMNAKDEEHTVKRVSRDNRKIWEGAVERPSLGEQCPWRFRFDTQWHHHMGKGPLKPQLKLLSLCHSLFLQHGRDLLKACAALWGLKHTTAATEEKWCALIIHYGLARMLKQR